MVGKWFLGAFIGSQWIIEGGFQAFGDNFPISLFFCHRKIPATGIQFFEITIQMVDEFSSRPRFPSVDVAAITLLKGIQGAGEDLPQLCFRANHGQDGK